MIFPTKHMPPDRSILIIGATILEQIGGAKSVSQLWEDVSQSKRLRFRITYDWFILTLVWLFIIRAVNFEDGLIKREGK